MNSIKIVSIILLVLHAVNLNAMQGAESQLLKNRQQLIEASQAYIYARALQLAAELDLADNIHHGLNSAEALAHALSLNAPALQRLLRVLASYGILYETNQGNFQLTQLGNLLRSNTEGSIKNYVKGAGDLWWNALRDLEYSVKTGKASFDQMYGTNYWDYLSKNPASQKRFNDALQAYSAQEDAQLARSFKQFGTFAKIADIGGGKGGLIKAIVDAYPKVEGILFDLPTVIADVAPAKRLELRAGDFFKWVPAGADAYIIKRVILDWDDQKTIELLSSVGKELKPNGSVFVINPVIKPNNERDFVRDFDMLMLALFGGRQRTETEYRNLFKQAGLDMVNITYFPYFGLAIMEGKLHKSDE